MKEDTIEPKLTKNALTVLKKRYLKKNDAGEVIETPTEMFWRVAIAVGKAEEPGYQTFYAQEFYEMMAKGLFMPNSPCLMNAGKKNQMMTACCVIPVEDSVEGIFDAVKAAAITQKLGAGTGYSFSRLRPKGAHVASSGGSTSGPISFMKVFSKMTEAIQQGSYRRGASLGCMRIDHPDIIDFINVKQDLKEMQNFNLSVMVTDEFIESLKNEHNSVPHFVEHKKWGRGLLWKNEEGVVKAFRQISGALNTCDIQDAGEWTLWSTHDTWSLICERAHTTGEPGILFYDTINAGNNLPNLGDIEACNACAEQPLLPWSNCTLGSINLAKMIADDGVNWTLFHDTIYTAVRFLDNVVSVGTYAVPEMKEMADKERRIGLGIMGWADMLFQLGIAYDSKEGLDLAEKVGRYLKNTAQDASMNLAKERGNFDAWKGSTWGDRKIPMRNSHHISFAPTGTISIIGACVVGDTLIHTINGKRKIKDLVGTAPIVYTSGKNEIRIKQASNVRKTAIKTEVWKLKFDNDDELIATPNHEIMLSNGTWKKLSELNTGDSVRTLEKSLWWPENSTNLPSFSLCMTNLPRKSEHRAIAEFIYNRDLVENDHVHHIDENRLNNNINNLEVLDPVTHSKLHARHIIEWSKENKGKTYNEIYGDEKAEEIKSKQSGSHLGEKNHRYGKKLSQEEKALVSKNTKKAMQRPEIKKKLKEGIERKLNEPGQREKIAKLTSERFKGRTPWNKGKKNHKVISVEYYGHEDVYNMEVADTENYVANGVVVHNCSGGIEPLFALAFERNVLADDTGKPTTMWEINPWFEKALEKYSPIAREYILKHVKENGTLKGYDVGQKDDFAVANSSLVIQLNELERVFKTAHEIAPEDHLKMQAAWQENCDSSISKTVNFSNSATIADIDKVYKDAHALGCKGVSVYRDGCRDGVEGMVQPMKTGKKMGSLRGMKPVIPIQHIPQEYFDGKITMEELEEQLIKIDTKGDLSGLEDKIEENEAFEKEHWKSLIPENTEKKLEAERVIPKVNPDFASAERVRLKTQFGTLHLKVVLDDTLQYPLEVFAQVGKGGANINADLEGMCRLISVSLQNDGDLDEMISQLHGIASTMYAPGPTGKIYSLPDALAQALIKWRKHHDDDYIISDKSTAVADRFDSSYGVPCPECGHSLTFESGCKICPACSWTAC